MTIAVFQQYTRISFGGDSMFFSDNIDQPRKSS